MIGYTHKEQTLASDRQSLLSTILPVEKFPGQLRYQPQVGVTDLARPYPHYGDILVVDGSKGGAMKYQALQIKLQKNYSHGLSLLVGYSYHVEKDQTFYNDIDTYNREYSWQNALGVEVKACCGYRHRITFARLGTFRWGKGRPL